MPTGENSKNFLYGILILVVIVVLVSFFQTNRSQPVPEVTTDESVINLVGPRVYTFLGRVGRMATALFVSPVEPGIPLPKEVEVALSNEGRIVRRTYNFSSKSDSQKPDDFLTVDYSDKDVAKGDLKVGDYILVQSPTEINNLRSVSAVKIIVLDKEAIEKVFGVKI
jgi:hypothetical protein